MRLIGSCHCSAVNFEFECIADYPYMRCYCQLCRKTAGSGGYAINLKGMTNSLKIRGKDYISEYSVQSDSLKREEHAGKVAKRFFCKDCGTSLWANNSAWLQWFFPFASAIDTPLPRPPESVHIMLQYAQDWCRPDADQPHQFEAYPNEGLEDWHKRQGLNGAIKPPDI